MPFTLEQALVSTWIIASGLPILLEQPRAGHRLIFYRSHSDSSIAVTDSTDAVRIAHNPATIAWSRPRRMVRAGALVTCLCSHSSVLVLTT